jgi:predicted nucleic acid-binding protein
VLYLKQSRYADAEPLYKPALAIQERAHGPDDPGVAWELHNLASFYDNQGRYAEAEPLHKRALAIFEKALGPDHRVVAPVLTGLAELYNNQGRYADAEPLYKRALAIQERAHPDHPFVAHLLNGLAGLYASTGNGEMALAYSRKASAAIFAHAANEGRLSQQKEQSGGLVEERARYSFAMSPISPLPCTRASSPRPHSAENSGALAALVRESQDLSAAWRAKDKALLAALSKPGGQQDRAAVDALRKQIVDLDGRIAAVAARLDRDFPEYAALSNPKPLAAEEAQKLLGADEALVFFLAGDKESYVFALTRDAFDWRTIPIGAKDLSAKIAAFRHGLDVDKLARSASDGGPECSIWALRMSFMRRCWDRWRDASRTSRICSSCPRARSRHCRSTCW